MHRVHFNASCGKKNFTLALLTFCCYFSGIAHSDALEVYNRAFEAHKKGEFAYAIQDYTQATDTDELDSEALSFVHHYRGKAFAQLVKFNLALQDFNTVIQLNSEINISYLDNSDQQRAVDYFMQSVASGVTSYNPRNLSRNT